MLRIAAVTLYKHGLGFFERAGHASGGAVTLSVPRRAMDDVLKSLTVVPTGGVTVRSVAFETPADRNADAQRTPVALDDHAAWASLVKAFAGTTVRVAAGDHSISGRLIGIEREDDSHLKRAVLLVASEAGVVPIPLATVTALRLDEPRSRDDLDFALAQRRRDEDRAELRIALGAAADVAVSYIAPAPAWRVSYRVLIGAAEAGTASRDVFVQGWALFDNTLDEDLDGVRLTLTAGMPVSFRYGLHQPNTPTRPLVQDEERTVSAPLEYEAGGTDDAIQMMAAPMAAMSAAPVARMKMRSALTAEALDDSAPVQAEGRARGALFAYVIDAPVSVRRGESGMVPIVSFRERGKRELIYNATKHAEHPAATVRVTIPATTTLERGPAIVLDAGSYGGEGVVPFSSGGSEIILGYAVELGVKVARQVTQREETSRISFRDRSVFIDTLAYTTTTYELTSTLAAPVEVVIEHQRQADASFDTAPETTSLALGRFRVALAARALQQVPIVERTLRRRYQDVTGLTGKAIQEFLRAKLLTADLAHALEVILALEAEHAKVENERRGLEPERKAIRARIDDAVKSLGALDPGRDGALRDRFVAQLDAHDSALQALDARDRALLERATRLAAEVDAAARSLADKQPA